MKSYNEVCTKAKRGQAQSTIGQVRPDLMCVLQNSATQMTWTKMDAASLHTMLQAISSAKAVSRTAWGGVKRSLFTTEL